MFERRDDGVGENVIDAIRAHRAGIAKVVHLNRCRSIRQNFRAAVSRIAFEIDEDVDRVIVDRVGRDPVGHVADGNVTIKRRDDAAAQFSAVIGAETIAEEFEAAAIHLFEDFDEEHRRCVREEVRREKSDADALADAAAVAVRFETQSNPEQQTS